MPRGGPEGPEMSREGDEPVEPDPVSTGGGSR